MAARAQGNRGHGGAMFQLRLIGTLQPRAVVQRDGFIAELRMRRVQPGIDKANGDALAGDGLGVSIIGMKRRQTRLPLILRMCRPNRSIGLGGTF